MADQSHSGDAISKTALLVIDMQNHFSSMTSQALPHINKLIQYFRSYDAPVIFTQHGHTKEELTPPIKNQVVKRWGPEESIAIGSHAWTLLPEIEEQVQRSPVVAKNTYDAFINTNLDELLQEQSIARVIICGVMTDCCCTTTARSAFNRGYETLFAEDACGTVDKKQHEQGVKGYEFAYGSAFKTDIVLKKLDAT